MGSGSTNVGTGCSCHSTSLHHNRATRVLSHPVWQGQLQAYRDQFALQYSIGSLFRSPCVSPDWNIGLRRFQPVTADQVL